MSRLVKSFLMVLAALVLVALAAGCSRGLVSLEEGEAYSAQPGSSHRPTNGAVQSNTGGAVTIDVEWVSADDAQLVFQVAMNTHSVDLDQYDLGTLAILRDDAGGEYHPLSWDSAPGGHHRRGTLIFPVPDSLRQGKAKHIEIIIRDVAGVEGRVLRWEL
ncbi:MAG TPA: hypothetical protein G4O01_03500 [Dehalococcoidia bacterium]|jgi:ABC-type glycerol-3-phosphate transport system substrate-binding protein|nr:hypothetical protein [Dehalococcoidia bacterium]